MEVVQKRDTQALTVAVLMRLEGCHGTPHFDRVTKVKVVSPLMSSVSTPPRIEVVCACVCVYVCVLVEWLGGGLCVEWLGGGLCVEWLGGGLCVEWLGGGLCVEW